MNKLRSPLRILVLCLFSLSLFSIAQAQRTFTYVAADGSDTSPCTISQPCRTFAVAHRKTVAGGEIIAVDSASYGPVTITKSISIVAPLSVYAEVATTNALGNAITINAGPSDTVVLRNLNIINHRSGQTGIEFTAGGSLSVEKCVIDGFADTGISVVNRNPENGLARVLISETIVRNNGGAGASIASPNGEGRTEAVVDRSLFEKNRLPGLGGSQGAIITVRNSIASGNGLYGFYAAFAGTKMSVENCSASNNNGGGIVAFENSVMRVSNSTVNENNGPGLLNSENRALFESRGNNTVRGNSPNVLGTITLISGT